MTLVRSILSRVNGPQLYVLLVRCVPIKMAEIKAVKDENLMETYLYDRFLLVEENFNFSEVKSYRDLDKDDKVLKGGVGKNGLNFDAKTKLG